MRSTWDLADTHTRHLPETALTPHFLTPPEPSAAKLKPHLGHWSQYAPHSY
ncbi:hypothetical protein OG609_03220 [Streptomyces sp. NBC_01224]|uniref:hypothetical protein n=1 Tax=Streptomyces sp. NBC_01224 TaxID=2903783 RepID=UPI002E0D11AE|nr:hypothetical protein OG609_03220 [Streptomyces sp. NBC_01224]